MNIFLNFQDRFFTVHVWPCISLIVAKFLVTLNSQSQWNGEYSITGTSLKWHETYKLGWNQLVLGLWKKPLESFQFIFQLLWEFHKVKLLVSSTLGVTLTKNLSTVQHLSIALTARPLFSFPCLYTVYNFFPVNSCSHIVDVAHWQWFIAYQQIIARYSIHVPHHCWLLQWCKMNYA
jgi:hypothetical protein